MRNNYLGMKIFQPHENQYATIIRYNKFNDCTIQFDDGRTMELYDLKSFRHGTINTKLKRKEKLVPGKTYTNNSGEKFVILEYNSVRDVVVKYENGIIKHLSSSQIRYKKHLSSRDIIKNKYLGKTKVAKNGMKMTIVEWNGFKDLIVRFEDGFKKKCSYTNFTRGNVNNPNVLKCKDTTGEISVSNQGLNMTVIGGNKTKVDIQFGDGTIVRKKGYHDFKRGVIKHPLLSVGKEFNGYTILKTLSKISKKDKYYLVEKEGFTSILTPRDMLLCN